MQAAGTYCRQPLPDRISRRTAVADGCSASGEEYAIHDYELPFEIDEYTSIEEVNRLCEMVEDLPEYIQEECATPVFYMTHLFNAFFT